MELLVTTDPTIMHGIPCFARTRVAVQSLFNHLEAGYTVDGFLAEFPTVKREQVIGLLEQRWLGTFSATQKQLEKCADEALAEFETGETLPMDLDRDFPHD